MGDVIQVAKSKLGNHGAPGQKREKKKKKTPEDIRRQNERNRWRKIQRIILANFKEGDWHLILKYRPGRGQRPMRRPRTTGRSSLIRCGRPIRNGGYPSSGSS